MVKLKSFTLIESIVAIIIVMHCFGIALSIFINVGKSDSHFLKMQAQLLLKQTLIETNNNNSFVDSESLYDDIKIKKTITKYNESNDNLRLVTYEAFDNTGRKLKEVNELIIIP